MRLKWSSTSLIFHFFILSTVLYSLDYSILDIQLKSQLLFINYITKYGKYKIDTYIGMSREFFFQFI